MADALVTVALEKLTDVLAQQLALFVGATDELRKIRRSLKHIEAVLHDAESMQVTQESVRLWLSELRQVAYDIEDLIDEHLENDASDGRSEIWGCAVACLPSPFTCFHSGVSHYQLGRSVREIRERLDEIYENKKQFKMSPISYATMRSFSHNRRPISYAFKEEKTIGRDEDEKALLRRLLRDADRDEDEKAILLSRLLLNVDEDDEEKVVLLSRLLHNVDGDGEKKVVLLSRLLDGISSIGDFDGLQQQQLVGENSSKQQQQLASASSGSGGEDGRLQLVGESSSPWKEDWQQKRLMGASSSIIGNKNGQQQQQLVGAGTITGNEDGRRQQQQQGNVVPVIAILAIGGQGKTTLARKIYNHCSVQDHFKNALYWVDVSKNFDEERLIKAIIEQVKGQGTSLSEPQALQNELIAALRGKRFLLVLDNLWNVDESKWNTLQPCLASGAEGSRILVTTRLRKVAERTVQAAYIHDLKGLPDIDSWKLFQMIALKGWNSHRYEQFKSVGRDIASKCNGVPLSIKVMGSLMNSKRTIEDWQNILDSNIWSFPQVENGILPALWLSYHNLPSHLKPCFVYCSIYQKGSVMSKDELVRMWIAQGFVRPEGNREREAIGDDYFNELVEWSILEPVGKNSRSKIISCTMHDLLHDLARFIAKDEIYTNIITNKDEQLEQSSSNNVRHECIYFIDNHDKLNVTRTGFGDVKKLRTIWINGVDGLGDVIFHILDDARLLRALVLRGSDSRIMKLPSAIGKMKHLRCLDVSGLNIEELPEAVSHLHNLHTLNVTHCRQLKKLPSGISKMAGLRHLEIKDTDSLEYLPKGLGKLRSLRSLCKFIVGGGEGGGCGINELQRLNSLQEILEIEHLERVSTKSTAKEAQLFNKKHLHRLVLRTLGGDVAENERTKSVVEGQLQNGNLERMLEGLWHHGKLERELEGLCALGNLEEVFEGLRPHINLFELELCRYTGSKLPSWIAQLPRLMILRLRICPMLKGLFHHDCLGSLDELMIEDCDAIKGLERCSVSFRGLRKITLINSSKFFSNGLPYLPSLKTLEIIIFENEALPIEGWERLEELRNVKIKHCSEMKSLPDGLMCIHELQYLHISYCDKLELLPKIVRNLKLNYVEIWECKALRSLPEGFGRFQGLQGLSIDGCPLLSQRCKMEGGEDWPKISHIPYISIDGKCIQK